LLRNNSGFREVGYLPKEKSVVRQASPMGNEMQPSISVTSLKHRNQLRAAESRNAAPMIMGRDNSVTHLPDVGLIAQPSEAYLNTITP
jgi:hypothetical protein